MSKDTDYFENQLCNAQHECTTLQIQLQTANAKIKELVDMNTRLADRNWELQKRIFESMALTKG